MWLTYAQRNGGGYFTAQKMKSSIKDFFSKWDQIRRKLRFGHIYWRKPSWKTSFFVQYFFVVDVCINNAYQIYCQLHLNPGEYRLDVLGFHWAIVDAYYRLYRKSLVVTGSQSLHHPVNNTQFDGINHWIAKDSQRRCSLPGCKGTSVYEYCKNCNVGLHAACFELYHCK